MAVGDGNALTHIRGVILLVPWVLWLCLADLAISLLLILKPFMPDFVYNGSSFIAQSVWRWIQVMFETFNGAEITMSGDVLPKHESAIVVANHVGWADFYMIQALAVRSGMLSRCRYFAKIQLRVVPFLGWGLWAMGMPMVSRNWQKDKRELDRVFSGIVDRHWPTCKLYINILVLSLTPCTRARSAVYVVRAPAAASSPNFASFGYTLHRQNYRHILTKPNFTGLISFSEATRYSQRKYEESKLWCKETDRPQPKHLLYPRTKGFITTVQHLRKAPHVKAVYVMALAYSRNGQFREAPTMWDTMSLPGLSKKYGYKFHVYARRFPIEMLPAKDEELASWLEERWVDMGEWLDVKKSEWESEQIVS
jgi:1-acyl-sn-glycerol-3-phosphate acyltransferase